MDAVLAFINGLIAQVPELSAGVVATVTIVLEFALRLFKSQKPLSILYAIALGVSKVGAILEAAASLVKKAGAQLDKVLPQRVQE